MRPNEDFRRSFEDMEFLRLGGAKSVFYSQYLEELRPEGSGSSIPSYFGGAEARWGFLEDLRFGGAAVWLGGQLLEER